MKMTASIRAKQGGINLNEMGVFIGCTRQTLHVWFKENPLKFDEALIKAMRLKCESNIKKINNSTEGKK
tara:strand:- start:295 stop:501 length:207 start_codon:yes stop_codon:yes gene_type:complete